MKACIDIGGTKVAVSLNTAHGLDLLARRSEPTAKTGDNDAARPPGDPAWWTRPAPRSA